MFFAVARAQNNRLARYFLQQGAKPGALFAAAWWGNADIVPDLVRHGADINEFVGATPLHTALEKEYDIEVFKLLLKHGQSRCSGQGRAHGSRNRIAEERQALLQGARRASIE